jgi:very-short-patch-repair endonuclease
VKTRIRELRKSQTPAEQALWELLRDRRLSGLKFRRQFPVRIFVADFCCYELKLIVELDGEVHEDARRIAHDENRDFYLRSVGYTVLRFSNREVFESSEFVLGKIAEVAGQLGKDPLPGLKRQ